LPISIEFILVEPAIPENVGFAARALKTMGFSQLKLVNPCDHLSKQAKKTAYASHDVLSNARLFDSLSGAISDIDLVIGTTAKKRTARHDYNDPGRLTEMIQNKENSIETVALVFGREESGLSKGELQFCDIISTIPMSASYPSLNLAQSVMIYTYELSSLKLNQIPVISPSIRELLELKKQAREILKWLGVDQKVSLHQRMLDRLLRAGSQDIHLFLSLAKVINQKRKHSN